MTSYQLDPAHYFLHETFQLLNIMSATYVDDLQRTGDAYFKSLSKYTRAKFKMDPYEYKPAAFTNFRIEKTSNGVMVVFQNSYCTRSMI